MKMKNILAKHLELFPNFGKTFWPKTQKWQKKNITENLKNLKNPSKWLKSRILWAVVFFFCHFCFFGQNFFPKLGHRSKCPTKIFFILIIMTNSGQGIYFLPPPTKPLILAKFLDFWDFELRFFVTFGFLVKIFL